MNILFVLKTMDMGGLEVVTSVLAHKFRNEGNNVYIFVFSEGTRTASDLFSDLNVVIGSGFDCSGNNIRIMRKLLVDFEIDVVINQWGLPFVPIKTIRRARKGLTVKVISVYHNDPLFNGRIKGVEILMQKTTNILKMALYGLKLLIFQKVTSHGMRYNYFHSDKFLVLSPSYIDHFKRFTGIKSSEKLLSLTNPVTIDSFRYVWDSSLKRKEIIYVGRVDYTQKRVSRVIDIWAYLEAQFPDWNLTIVGNGDAMEHIETQVKAYGLKRVSFEGFQPPNKYYERAKILLLTSDFEGFPLVLAECMSFGVVPAVYGSFSAVYDIIEDNKNGIIIPPEACGFNAETMAKRISAIMEDDKLYEAMAEEAILASGNYSIDVIYLQWIQLFDLLMRERD